MCSNWEYVTHHDNGEPLLAPYWRATNVVHHDIRLFKVNYEEGTEEAKEPWYARVDGRTFSNFGMTKENLIRNLEATFSWIVY